jgi:UDP-N-acetylglucosamine--N-acetylmuramyl-(pentapeptide) pyrophosphoryl-undecaprenol N-acetylglucosamine transferase
MTTARTPARIVFAGGGTGGHLYPAIAIADQLRSMLDSRGGAQILFVGTRRGLEYRLGDKLGYPLHLINMRGIVRSLSLKNLLVPFVVITALLKATALITRVKPHVVVGTGGYVAWPVLRAAVARGIPTVLQEQNSFPGIVTRRLAPRVDHIFLGFERAREYLRTKAPTEVVGNPVRSNIHCADRESAARKYGLDPNKKTILVLGGSQGARAINRAVTKSVQAGGLPDDIQLLWQTGIRDYKDVSANVGNRVSSCTLFPFAEEMNEVYALADLAIVRAGALTLAELTACGLPSILIPYPYAAGDHQRHNAREMVDRGMARLVDEDDLADHDILNDAAQLLKSGQYAEMKKSIVEATAGRRPAVEIIAEKILEMIDNANKDGESE